MSQLQILTQFGKIFAPRGEPQLREIARDLGIACLTRSFGDMLFGNVPSVPVSVDELRGRVSNCYFAVNGSLVLCTEASRLRLPVDQVHSACRTTTGRLVLCCRGFRTVDHGDFRPRMELARLEEAASAVEILELYRESGEYEFALSPSAAFMVGLMARTDVCLFGGGWCVVDLRPVSVPL